MTSVRKPAAPVPAMPGLALVKRAARVGWHYGLPRAQLYKLWNVHDDTLECYLVLDSSMCTSSYRTGDMIAMWEESEPCLFRTRPVVLYLKCKSASEMSEITETQLRQALLERLMQLERERERELEPAPELESSPPRQYLSEYPGDRDSMSDTQMHGNNDATPPQAPPPAPTVKASGRVVVSKEAVDRLLSVLLEMIDAVDKLVTSAGD